jgi:lysophospholipase L1-like esterase
MRQINDWIRMKAAHELRVAFVDTRRAVAARDDDDRLSESPDGLHPSPQGYRRMAEGLLPQLERLISP